MEYEELADYAAAPATGEVLTAQTETGVLAATASATADRKIIYTSSIGLVVEDYQTFEAELPKLVNQHGGFVASSDTDRRYQNNQSGRWVVRIPVDQYNNFLSGVNALGFAESRSEVAQDVTEEYVDVEARIENKKRLESRILTMLATITINCREEREYTPPQPPTLLSRITNSWTVSLTSLRRTGENLLVGTVAIAPWLVVLAIPILIIRYVITRWWRKRRQRKMNV